MNVLELIDQRNAKVDAMNAAINVGETDKRKLNDDETLNIRTLDNEIAEINKQISEIQGQKLEVNDRNKLETTMETRKSLVAQINERMSGSNNSAISLDMEERAAVNVSTQYQGQEIVGTDVMNIVAPLRAALVLTSAGAQFLTGLKNNVQLPLYATGSAAWESEVSTGVYDGVGAFSKVTLSPKRLTAYVEVSKLALAQDTVGMESMIMEDIVKNIAIKLENTIFGKANGSATQPAGFFASGNSRTITGSTTYAKIVSLETAVDTANANVGNLKYITNAGGKGVLKTTPKIGSTYPQFIMDGTQANGYDVLSTNNVAKQLNTGANEFGIVYGNWSDFVIAQWGPIDLIVDPYTEAKDGKVLIVVNAFFDAAPRRAASFAIGSIKA